MRFSNNLKVHASNVNEMTIPLPEKSSQLVEKSRPMSSNLWFLPQTESR